MEEKGKSNTAKIYTHKTGMKGRAVIPVEMGLRCELEQLQGLKACVEAQIYLVSGTAGLPPQQLQAQDGLRDRPKPREPDARVQLCLGLKV